MMRFDPFREIEELQQRVDRAFGLQNGQNRYAPTVDIHEDEDGLEISLDLPGIDPQDIRVEAENNTVMVQAERRYEQKQGRTAHRQERAYGTFVRTFNIPARYDLSRIEASHEHGSLTLRVPRSEAAMKRTIAIKSSVSNQPQTIEAVSSDASTQNTQ
ncbi:Hsp20/alpha crystallin family protein [Deinococcus pimensis]|uniref:Hsp20/alpha crystallin family protein n=1 Tax=Deinococcus pimensis TaxID=309888 RepID=UPI0004B56E35|nr:Hsp20/alpha crystallin family protein [Deinococcus pimensis]